MSIASARGAVRRTVLVACLAVIGGVSSTGAAEPGVPPTATSAVTPAASEPSSSATTVSPAGSDASAHAVSAAGQPAGRDGSATPKLKQYLYLLKLTPRLHSDDAWTAADNAAVQRHFAQLQQATATGKVILAGRTLEPGDRTFGLVIFEAVDDEQARQFMESDPAVVAGVMTATLHPYSVALQRRP